MKNLKKETIALGILLLATTVTFAQREEKGERPDGPPNTDQIFKDLDRNEDQKISLKEVKGPLKKDFNKIDLNEDGFITKEELEKAPKPKRREKRQ